ncbi:MAG: 50S ribosomal protein L24 [Candidatus Woesearchaeota archaeon]|nr:MAG: 50S ribosomal protein L24 [Candidatus Woesearchaeota archaeon]
MKKDFVKTWNRSVQPRKQRKYVANAPKHLQSTLNHSHLSGELRNKYARRSLRVRTGDKVKVIRGSFKNVTGKVERVDVGRRKIYIAGVELTKKDGSKARRPIHPSNLIIMELDLSDKRRKEKLEAGVKNG